MAVVQRTYERRAQPLVAGQIANTQTCDIDTMISVNDDPIPFGRMVYHDSVAGAGAHDAKLGAVTGRTRGVAIQDERIPASDGVAFARGERIPVMWRGDVAVRVEAAVVADDNAYADAATGELSSEALQAITSVTVTDGGSGYTSVPTIAFSGGGGTGAAATAVVEGGVVVRIEVTNNGSGYTSVPTIAFSGGGGSGAAGTVVVQGAALLLSGAKFLRAAAAGGISVLRLAGVVQSS